MPGVLGFPRHAAVRVGEVEACAGLGREPGPGTGHTAPPGRWQLPAVLLGLSQLCVVSACPPSQIIKQSVLELKLQAEESFVLKVVQLEELLQVRHSVFVIGNAGCGKSQVAATCVPEVCSSLAWGCPDLGMLQQTAARRRRSKAAGALTGPAVATAQVPSPAGAEVAQQDLPEHEAEASRCGPRPKSCDLR